LVHLLNSLPFTSSLSAPYGRGGEKGAAGSINEEASRGKEVSNGTDMEHLKNAATRRKEKEKTLSTGGNWNA
jgi:hypothetical protein